MEVGSEGKIQSMYRVGCLDDTLVNLSDQKTPTIMAGMTLNDNKVDFEVGTCAVLAVMSQSKFTKLKEMPLLNLTTANYNHLKVES